jgi:hypothetical protein
MRRTPWTGLSVARATRRSRLALQASPHGLGWSSPRMWCNSTHPRASIGQLDGWPVAMAAEAQGVSLAPAHSGSSAPGSLGPPHYPDIRLVGQVRDPSQRPWDSRSQTSIQKSRPGWVRRRWVTVRCSAPATNYMARPRKVPTMCWVHQPQSPGRPRRPKPTGCGLLSLPSLLSQPVSRCSCSCARLHASAGNSGSETHQPIPVLTAPHVSRPRAPASPSPRPSPPR